MHAKSLCLRERGPEPKLGFDSRIEQNGTMTPAVFLNTRNPRSDRGCTPKRTTREHEMKDTRGTAHGMSRGNLRLYWKKIEPTAMREDEVEVFTSTHFVHHITKGSLQRQYCLIEARAAMKLGKPCLMFQEDNSRHAGYISFADANKECPVDLVRCIFGDQRPILLLDLPRPIVEILEEIVELA